MCLEVMQGFDLALNFTHITATVQRKQIIFNSYEQVDLQTIEHGQGIYTDPLGINTN